MNKRNLVALCAIAAAALTFSACNESVEYSASEPVCGNGEIETGEVCDVTVPDAMTCAEFDNTKVWSSGKPGCSSECKLTVGTCVENVTNTCGNGVKDAGEDCDASASDYQAISCAAHDSSKYSDGMLSCNACKWDVTACTEIVVDEKCGNGVKDEGEDCDASVEGAAAYMCADYDSSKYSDGVMSCSACKWDASACTEIVDEKCGNGVKDEGEDCDSTASDYEALSCVEHDSSKYSDGMLSCNACKWDVTACTEIVVDEKCGNGELDEGEDCDDTVEGYVALSCVEHDSSMYSGGNLSCNACKWDASACTEIVDEKCGNGELDEGEDCDDTVEGYAALSCVEHDSSKYSDGMLSCNACKWDVTSCTEISGETCGNGKLDEGEDCDDSASDYEALSCVEHDSSKYSDGMLSCNACKWDVTACTEISGDTCGNGKLDEGEDCDDSASDYEALSCVEHDSSKYSDGMLSCNACKWDVTACTEITANEYDYNVVLDWAQNLVFAKISATDFIVDDVKIASVSGYGAINDNTTENYYDEFNGSTVTFTGNKKYNCHVLVNDIVGGVKEFAFDYRRWLPTKTDNVAEGVSTIQVLVDGEIVMDDIKLESSKLTTIKVTVDKEDAKSVKIQVKEPQKTRNIQRAVIGNLRWSKF